MELAHTALVPVIEQAGIEFTVSTSVHVLLQLLVSLVVTVSVKKPGAPAVTVMD
jgi:hypothetical protein